ncbi:uncharacterized protein LOC124658422 isoform X1 [Lolium rigidum]|uniref:uncharacterized protein LOC124658422 isoform X1 n=1 Tax=Lolium rigidum TaxID=89674 RepID=UPI001F5E04E0|nr:uncharacterized protein LOC124658422 isoform X1 [Lolium rigidum]
METTLVAGVYQRAVAGGIKVFGSFVASKISILLVQKLKNKGSDNQWETCILVWSITSCRWSAADWWSAIEIQQSDVAGLFGWSRRRTWRRRAATISQRQEPGATGAELCVLEIEAIRASWAARKRIERICAFWGSWRPGDRGDQGMRAAITWGEAAPRSGRPG